MKTFIRLFALLVMALGTFVEASSQTGAMLILNYGHSFTTFFEDYNYRVRFETSTLVGSGKDVYQLLEAGKEYFLMVYTEGKETTIAMRVYALREDGSRDELQTAKSAVSHGEMRKFTCQATGLHMIALEVDGQPDSHYGLLLAYDGADVNLPPAELIGEFYDGFYDVAERFDLLGWKLLATETDNIQDVKESYYLLAGGAGRQALLVGSYGIDELAVTLSYQEDGVWIEVGEFSGPCWQGPIQRTDTHLLSLLADGLYRFEVQAKLRPGATIGRYAMMLIGH